MDYIKTKRKSAFYHMRRYHNFIKRNLIEAYKGATVLDLASGKGGDLQKYLDNGFQYIEGYDLDVPSVIEANRRKEYFQSQSKYSHAVINLLPANLITTRIKSNIAFDVIVCNFAFHYFFKQPENILMTISENSKKGTVLLLTLLEENLVKETDTKNLKIKRLDQQRILVYIKDSVLDKPREEYLVSKENLIVMMEAIGFKMISMTNFAELYQSWLKSPIGNSLTYNEKKYSFMNNAYVFIKK